MPSMIPLPRQVPPLGLRALIALTNVSLVASVTSCDLTSIEVDELDKNKGR